MKIRQNPRHWATKKALTTPGISSLANYGLVKLHTNIFAGKADEAHREERKPYLDALFDATIDAYTAALQADYSEAEAREITHIQANFDFFDKGWTEMMEIPADEFEAHYRRYEAFFSAHGITIDDPLGEFRPPEGLPDAPATPERLDDPTYENAVAGFADDTYVETPGGMTVGGDEEPENVDVGDAVGVSDDNSTGEADD